MVQYNLCLRVIFLFKNILFLLSEYEASFENRHLSESHLPWLSISLHKRVNNPFDKAKSLIDIQEGIEDGNITEDMKVKMSKVIDELLIGDAEVTDEVGIAALLIRDLIPKESQIKLNYSLNSAKSSLILHF